jgi:hypothetical protein
MIMHISKIETSDKEVVFKTKPECEHWSQHTWLGNSGCFLPALCAEKKIVSFSTELTGQC